MSNTKETKLYAVDARLTRLRIDDRAVAEAFIKDLRRAVRKSARTGGEYATYVDCGGNALVVAVQLTRP